MKDILLVTNFWHFREEKASSRYRTLAEMLSSNGYNVEVVTSDFYHRTKKKRNFDEEYLCSSTYKITLINEPIYKKNISLKRIYSHYIFSNNVIRYLKSRNRPDVIIVVIPSTFVAKAVIKFSNIHEIPTVLDIQDLWPEAFKMAIDIPYLSNLLFLPIKLMANFAYKNANYITAVSETYVKYGMKSNNKDKKSSVIYLGSDYDTSRRMENSNYSISKPENEFWVTYIGALGLSYNLNMVIEALSLVRISGIENIVFNIFGNGELEESVKSLAIQKGINAKFYGHIEYDKMMEYLSLSDIAVNPIIGKSVSSVINKVCDYAAAGLPVINDQNSIEYRNLLETYNAGINCENNNVREFADAVLVLFRNEKLRLEMAQNALFLAEEKFIRKRTYREFLNIINEISV